MFIMKEDKMTMKMKFMKTELKTTEITIILRIQMFMTMIMANEINKLAGMTQVS